MIVYAIYDLDRGWRSFWHSKEKAEEYISNLQKELKAYNQKNNTCHYATLSVRVLRFEDDL